MVDPFDWNNAVTLEEYVMKLFQEEKTQSKEFQILLRIYGREKLLGFWQKYQKQMKCANPNSSDSTMVISRPRLQIE